MTDKTDSKEVSEVDENKDLGLYDETEKYSLISILPDRMMRDRLKELRPLLEEDRTEDWFDKNFGHDKNKKTMRRLRLSFWHQVFECQNLGIPLQMKRVYSGITSFNSFYRYIKDDFYAQFFFTMPHKVEAIQRDIIYLAYEEMEKIIQLPVIDDKGLVNDKLVKQKIDLLKHLEDRAHGSVIHRSEEKRLNLNQNVSSKVDVADKSMEEIQKEIQELEKKLGKKNDSDVVDAEFTEK